MSLEDGAGRGRALGREETRLLFARTLSNLPSMLPRLAISPKAAYCYGRAALSFFAKDYDAVFRWKTDMFRSIFGIAYTKYMIRGGGLEMAFDQDDLQVYNVILQNQYNLSPETVRGKVVIDAGANTGVFSVFAAKLGAKKVYSFEPILENIECIRKNAAANGVANIVEPVPMAVGNRKFETEIEYSGRADPSASLALAHPRAGSALKKQKIAVTTIDDFASSRGIRLDFLKMDIEGYEKEALAGGRETIRACKPILAFSAYHKPEDKVELPKTVKSIRQDYEGELLNRAEEVFYFR